MNTYGKGGGVLLHCFLSSALDGRQLGAVEKGEIRPYREYTLMFSL